MVNEVLWAGGMATLMQCYSVRGLAAVAGINISSTIGNVFNVVYLALGNSWPSSSASCLGQERWRKRGYGYEADCIFRLSLP